MYSDSMRKFGQLNAFSLIEIIIAIAIIAIFITLPVLAYSNYAKNSRDEKRKGDVLKVAQALEQYKAERGTYPINLEELVSQGYLPELPIDPKNEQDADGDSGTLAYGYDYNSDGVTYSLSAILEETEDPDGDGPEEAGPVVFIADPVNPKGKDAPVAELTQQAADNPSPTVPSNTPYISPTSGVALSITQVPCNQTIVCNGTCQPLAGRCASGPNTYQSTQSGCNFTTRSGSQNCSQTAAPNQACTISSQTCTNPLVCIGTNCATPTNTPTNTPTATFTPSPTPQYWARAFNEAGWSDQIYAGLIIVPRGTGYLAMGSRYSPSGSAQGILINLNGAGVATSMKALTIGTYLDAYTPTTDGGGLLVSNFRRVVKLDSSLNMSWSKNITGNDHVQAVAELPSGQGYVFAGGQPWATTDESAFLVKTTAAGDFAWERNFLATDTYTSLGKFESTGVGVAVSSNSRIGVVHSYKTPNGAIYNYDLPNEYTVTAETVYFNIYDVNGTLITQQELLGQRSLTSEYFMVEYGAYDMVEIASNGNNFAVAYPMGFGANTKARIQLFDTAGTKTGTVDIDNGTIADDIVTDMVYLGDGSLLISGYTLNPSDNGNTSVGFITKLNSSLGQVWTRTINLGAANYSSALGVSVNGSDIIVNGYYSDGANGKPYIAKLNSNGLLTNCTSFATGSYTIGVPTATPLPGGRVTSTPVPPGGTFFTSSSPGRTTSSTTSTQQDVSYGQSVLCTF